MKNNLFLFLLLIGLLSCKTSQTVAPLKPVEITILQINDVYEIAPLEGGRVGGLARVAGLLRQLEADNPNTLAVLAGDFLSPSFMGTLKMDDGERIAGLQMVETLNAMGLDYATFGNHEFDLKTATLLEKRLAQSEFEYTCANVDLVTEEGQRRPFQQGEQAVPRHSIQAIQQDGQTYKLAIVGVCLPFNKRDFVHYEDVTEAFQREVNAAREEADIVLGLTHLNVDEDVALAADVPGLPLFMGGHEHHQLSRFVGNTAITKADANAKTVYVHHLTYYPSTGQCAVRSEIVPITAELPEDPATAAVVSKWQNQIDALVTGMGYNASEKLTTIDYTLVGSEGPTRSSQTNYGRITNQAVERAWPGADVYLFNSGSLRIDDNLTGTITSYDVLRSFPYGGPVVRMSLPGNALQQVLNTGDNDNRGEGGYLQRLGAKFSNGSWLIQGEALDLNTTYVVVMPEFLAQGREARLDLLGSYTYDEIEQFTIGNEELKNDLRDLVIDYLRTL